MLVFLHNIDIVMCVISDVSARKMSESIINYRAWSQLNLAQNYAKATASIVSSNHF